MNKTAKITIAVLAAALAYDECIILRNRKKTEKLYEQGLYLAKILEDNEIKPTEFDRIALETIAE